MSEETKVPKELWGETWSITPSLRWNGEVLEQAWTNNRTSDTEWRVVPQIGEETIG